MANMLNIEKIIKLRDWYGTRAEMLRERTRKQIAQRAAGELGFEVTDSNIQAIEGALGIERNNRGGSNSSGRDRVAVVAKIVEKLLLKLGEPVPAELQDIIHHRAPK